jgi:hypothetical protein
VSRKLSSPPTINGFGDHALDAGELAMLQRCQSGDCALRLGDPAIARFRAEVDWAAADAGRRANLLTRQLMLGYTEAYLRGGDDGGERELDREEPLWQRSGTLRRPLAPESGMIDGRRLRADRDDSGMRIAFRVSTSRPSGPSSDLHVRITGDGRCLQRASNTRQGMTVNETVRVTPAPGVRVRGRSP